eukprot:EG_transcript_22817
MAQSLVFLASLLVAGASLAGTQEPAAGAASSSAAASWAAASGVARLTVTRRPGAHHAVAAVEFCGVPDRMATDLGKELQAMDPSVQVTHTTPGCTADLEPLGCSEGGCRHRYRGQWAEWPQHPTARLAARSIHAHLWSHGNAQPASNDVGERIRITARPADPLPTLAAAFLVLLALFCQPRAPPGGPGEAAEAAAGAARGPAAADS